MPFSWKRCSPVFRARDGILSADWRCGLGPAEPWRQKLLAASAGLLWRQRQPLTILRFLHLIGDQAEERAWQQIALLEGLPSMPVKTAKGAEPAQH